MMDTTPAFPRSAEYGPNGTVQYSEPGLTKRVYVATEVLKGLLASTPHHVTSREETVAEAYRYADLLLEKQHQYFGG